MGKVDLHTHSRKSDGSLSPGELITAARMAELKTIALTDHDTLSGLDEAMHAGEIYGVEVVPGCELSASSDHGPLHILGLWVDKDSTDLTKTLQSLRRQREARIENIFNKLSSLGIDISSSEIIQNIQGEIETPYLAAALMEQGVVKSMGEAFEKFLGRNGQAFIPKVRMAPEDAINLLLSAGAMPVLAHPFIYSEDKDIIRDTVSRLKAMGLQAIETYYGTHDREQEAFCEQLGAEFDLGLSGGSDFHGAAKPHISLGLGNMDSRKLDALKKRKFS